MYHEAPHKDQVSASPTLGCRQRRPAPPKRAGAVLPLSSDGARQV